MSIESIETLDEEEKIVRGKSHLHELENRWRKVMNEVFVEDENAYCMDVDEFRNLRYRHFSLPLLKTKSKDQEWIAYQDYLLAI
jgi:hypothetical protein